MLSVLIGIICQLLLTETQKILSQSDFDKALESIKRGEQNSLLLAPGTYYMKAPVVSTHNLSITGIGATITYYDQMYNQRDAIKETSTHYVCKVKSTIEPFSLFSDDESQLVKVSESVLDSIGVNIITKKLKYEGSPEKAGSSLMIPIPDNLKHLANKKFSSAYGYIECGWSRVCFTLSSSDNTVFYCKTIGSTNVPSFEYDINVYNKNIRFVIFNTELKSNSIYYDNELIYIPKNILRLVQVNNDNTPTIQTYGNLNLLGVSFNNVKLSISSRTNNICSINRCNFKNTLGTTILLSKKNSEDATTAVINKCSFTDCSILSGNIIKVGSETLSHNCVTISDCILSRYPSDICHYKNCSGMIDISADATITDCELYNTPRDHIFITRGDVQVRGNRIFNSDKFNNKKWKNLSCDFGLVYVGFIFNKDNEAIDNRVNRVLIDGNLIYGSYGYAEDARGVFIDDGRGDVTCQNNAILKCQMFTIDSREVPNFVGTASIRNKIVGNLLGGRYRLQKGAAVPSGSEPISKENYIIEGGENAIKGITTTDLKISKDSSRKTFIKKSYNKKQKSFFKKEYKQYGF